MKLQSLGMIPTPFHWISSALSWNRPYVMNLWFHKDWIQKLKMRSNVLQVRIQLTPRHLFCPPVDCHEITFPRNDADPILQRLFAFSCGIDNPPRPLTRSKQYNQYLVPAPVLQSPPLPPSLLLLENLLAIFSRSYACPRLHAGLFPIISPRVLQTIQKPYKTNNIASMPPVNQSKTTLSCPRTLPRRLCILSSHKIVPKLI